MKKFAVFDIDGTLFRWQLFHEVVRELIDGGFISTKDSAAIDEKLHAWRERKHPRSWHEYEYAITTAFIHSIKDLPVAAMEAAADAVLQRSARHTYTYTRDLIATLRQKGYTLIALSGSQDEIVQRFAKKWKFDIAVGQTHDIKNGKYTGTIPTDTLLTRQKGALLKKIVTEHGLTWHESIAVGDSHSDSTMLALVDIPIAFNPTDDLFETASQKGWKVVVERKNMIYELEPRNGTYLLANAGPR